MQYGSENVHTVAHSLSLLHVEAVKGCLIKNGLQRWEHCTGQQELGEKEKRSGARWLARNVDQGKDAPLPSRCQSLGNRCCTLDDCTVRRKRRG